jgi:hypothetical protein
VPLGAGKVRIRRTNEQTCYETDTWKLTVSSDGTVRSELSRRGRHRIGGVRKYKTSWLATLHTRAGNGDMTYVDRVAARIWQDSQNRPDVAQPLPDVEEK